MMKLKKNWIFLIFLCISLIAASGIAKSFVLFVPDTNAGWIPRITVVNDDSVEHTDIVVHYVLPDEFAEYDDVGFSFEPSQGNVTEYIEDKSIQFDWNVGTLAPGENATLDVIVWTDFYSENHDFASTGTYELDYESSVTSDQIEEEEELGESSGGGGGGTITTYATADSDNDGTPNHDDEAFMQYFVSPENCGDGVVDIDEKCDNGANNGIRCNALYGESCIFCSEICTDAVVFGGHCGDFKVNDSEECDDGNRDNSDKCRNDCTLNSCGECPGEYLVRSCDECISGYSCYSSYGCINHNEYEACGNGFICKPKEGGISKFSLAGIILAALLATMITVPLIKRNK